MGAELAPVLGVVLKGYPRISETFISNEILLLEGLGFAVRIFSMRPGREGVTHASVQRIRARVDYLPEVVPARTGDREADVLALIDPPGRRVLLEELLVGLLLDVDHVVDTSQQRIDATGIEMLAALAAR